MISLKTADSALKNVYLDVIKNQLNHEVDPFYSKIVKTEQDVNGSEIKKMVTIGISGGIGAGAEDGSLPISKETNYAVLTSKLKNLYGQLEISDKALRASQSESGAFLNLLNAEMDNLIESSKFNLRRMLYGMGNSYLGTSGSKVDVGSTVYPVVNPSSFMVGMKVNAVDDFGEDITFIKNAEILDVDYTNKTITLPASCAFVAEGELPFKFYFANSAGEEIIGLNGIMDAGAVPVLYGLNRENNSFLTPTLEGIDASSFTLPKVLEKVDNLKINYNANIDIIVTGYLWRRRYQDSLKTFAVNTDTVTLEGGYKAITLNGIPVYSSRFVGQYNSFMLDSSTFKIHQLCDWTWLSNDKGEILHQKEGYASHTATLVKYCDLICDKPCKNALIFIN